jgi:uncharacterized protein YrzB (UPF0473 family)
MKLGLFFSFILLTSAICNLEEFSKGLLKSLKPTIENQYPKYAKCLDLNTLNDLEKLIEFIFKKDIENALILSATITERIRNNCPDELNHFTNNLTFETIQAQISKFLNSPLMQGLLNLRNEEKKKQIVFLEDEDDSDSDDEYHDCDGDDKYPDSDSDDEYHDCVDEDQEFDWDIVFEGIMSGLARNDESVGCYNDISKFRYSIIDFIKGISTSFKRFDFTKPLKQALEISTLLYGYNRYCHFDEVSNILLTITTAYGKMNLLWRVIFNLNSLISDARQMYVTYRKGQYDLFGKHMGRFIQVTLGYTID